jgi:hypothetical protein
MLPVARRRAVTETRPSYAKRWISWVAAHDRRAIVLVAGGSLVVAAGAAWAIFGFLNGPEGKSELLAYQLCVGLEQKLCPGSATFVRNQGEDTVAKWAQKECASYKTRRIIISDGPTKECNCYLADVRCSSE